MTQGVNRYCGANSLIDSTRATSDTSRRSREPPAYHTARPGQRWASIARDEIGARKSGAPPGLAAYNLSPLRGNPIDELAFRCGCTLNQLQIHRLQFLDLRF
jgi:hypothetical protein